jgi:serine/threonine kinase 16
MVMSTLMRLVRWLWDFLLKWFRKKTGTVITLDTGKRVILGKQIAEGGFSFVFEAWDADEDDHHQTKTTSHSRSTAAPSRYALKRIHCPDPDLLQACRREAQVHRAVQHPNLMPLLGFTVVHQSDCYMLFPYCSQSLRDVVNRRNPLLQNNNKQHTSTAVLTASQAPPWPEPATPLNLFWKICDGVQALHEHGYSHRDIKLENVLLLGTSNSGSGSSNHHLHHRQPVLMDFGSAGPIQQPVTTRRHCLEIVEQAAQHTTLPYRPPELFEGGIRFASDQVLDYRAVDVWSLGCTLHAILYGASPFECEFVSAPHGGGMKIVECTHLSVLGNLPTPQPPVSSWYSNDIRCELIEPMLAQDRFQRPTLPDVMARVEHLIRKLGGRVDRRGSDERRRFQDDDDDDDSEHDGIALMSRVV